jgi:protein-L-isoaspartate(D-aspartate) O-methyltransferase
MRQQSPAAGRHPLRRALPWLAVVAVPLALWAAGQSTPPSWRPALERAGVDDWRIHKAMEKVRRYHYLPPDQRGREFQDRPLPIGHGQNTSQPTLIAAMIEQLALRPGCRVLEVGTGCGYQTALLAELCETVASVDILEPLARQAEATLRAQGYTNVKIRAGDGYLGWPELAPFDGIVVSAGAAKVPAPLVEQLAPGGRLVIPVGEADEMRILVLHKNPDGSVDTEARLPVRFVPLQGPHAERDRGE